MLANANDEEIKMDEVTRWAAKRDKRWRWYWSAIYLSIGVAAFLLLQVPQSSASWVNWLAVGGGPVAAVGLWAARPAVQIAGICGLAVTVGGYLWAVSFEYDNTPHALWRSLVATTLFLGIPAMILVARTVDIFTYPPVRPRAKRERGS